MRVRLLRISGFAWRRTGDASVLSWLFPNIWTKLVTILSALGTTAVGIIWSAPPVLYVPAALGAALIGRLALGSNLHRHPLTVTNRPGLRCTFSMTDPGCVRPIVTIQDCNYLAYTRATVL